MEAHAKDSMPARSTHRQRSLRPLPPRRNPCRRCANIIFAGTLQPRITGSFLRGICAFKRRMANAPINSLASFPDRQLFRQSSGKIQPSPMAARTIRTKNSPQPQRNIRVCCKTLRRPRSSLRQLPLAISAWPTLKAKEYDSIPASAKALTIPLTAPPNFRPNICCGAITIPQKLHKLLKSIPPKNLNPSSASPHQPRRRIKT